MVRVYCKLVFSWIVRLGLKNAYRTALGLMFINGADDVIRVAEILEEYFVELPLLISLQGTLLTHKNKHTQYLEI